VTARARMDRVARMSLALPDTTVKPSHGAQAYQVRGKSFAMVMHDHHGNGRTELWVKGSPDAQQEWVAGDARRYYVPPYVGPNGWIGAWLDVEVDWQAIAELLAEGYLIQAGRRAAAGLEPVALVAAALAAH
jgi:predicted DNA-binding protein (MmcQ/YjbR family)